jgi:hypothetical protein
MLSLAAGGGLKASLLWGDRAQKIGGSVVALIVIGLALWLAANFSVWLFENFLSGDLWCLIGFAIGLIFTTKKLAEPSVDPAADLIGKLGDLEPNNISLLPGISPIALAMRPPSMPPSRL